MKKRSSLSAGLLVMALVAVPGTLLAKQALPPQIIEAIKSWQQCAAAAYKAERQIEADKDAAVEARFASCQAQFETIVARASENGLEPQDVRQALFKSKVALKKQMTAP